MDKKKLYNFLMFIPFAVALGSFVLYFKYLYTLNSVKTLKVTQLMEVSLVRYRNIGVFCLALGIFLLFIKTLIQYLSISDNSHNEKVLDRISNKVVDSENKYSFNETNIVNDLLKEKVLTAVFYNSTLEDRSLKFKNYNNEKNIIEFYDLTKNEVKEEKKQDSKKIISTPMVINSDIMFNSDEFKECPKCKNMIAKDAIMCVHCGTGIKVKKEKNAKTNLFNPVKFALNMILILLCIIVLLLCLNKIKNQSEINKNNFNVSNIKTVETK